MISLLISGVTDSVRLMLALAVAGAPLTAFPASRRALFATVRFVVRKTPARMRWLLAAAQFCPGQIDDIPVLAIVLVPVLRVRHNRQVLRRIALPVVPVLATAAVAAGVMIHVDAVGHLATYGVSVGTSTHYCSADLVQWRPVLSCETTS